MKSDTQGGSLSSIVMTLLDTKFVKKINIMFPVYLPADEHLY